MWRRSMLVSCALAGAGALVTPAGAETPVATRATQWLLTQQQPDGGFETVGFPFFETPDAVMAIARQAQADPSSWSAADARAAVLALRTPLGTDPLDSLDDQVESDVELSAGEAAKVVVLSTNPLGIDPSSFDPSCDGPDVDLGAVIDANLDPAGFYAPQAAFNGTLFAVIAKTLMQEAPEATTLAYIRSVQREDGGWNFNGSPDNPDPQADIASDPDTTALALVALAAAGIGAGDADFDAGVEFLLRNQQDSGAWQAFGSDDPNSTAVAVLGLTAAGYDGDDPEIGDAIEWLATQQQPDGRIASPNDVFGINTFATSQAIQVFLPADVPSAHGSYEPVLCWTPDAQVRTAKGEYTEGKVAKKRPAGKATKYFVRATNASAHADRLILRGTETDGGFTVTYTFEDGNGEVHDITSAITSGTYTTPKLDAGESQEIKVRVDIGADVPPKVKRTVRVTTTSYADPTKHDVVKAVTKVK